MFPCGKAARATRAVSSGTAANGSGRSDISFLLCRPLQQKSLTATRAYTAAPTFREFATRIKSTDTPDCAKLYWLVLFTIPHSFCLLRRCTPVHRYPSCLYGPSADAPLVEAALRAQPCVPIWIVCVNNIARQPLPRAQEAQAAVCFLRTSSR
jgi:hypothetical protein